MPNASVSSSHLMPNAVDLSDEIQGMISHAAMMSKRAKVNAELSAYDPDPMSLASCKKSNNWENPKQGNSWKQAIMNEIGNLKKFDVFKIIPLSGDGTKIFSIVIGYLTKRTKTSTPEHEDVDKRKCRMCLGGHRPMMMIAFITMNTGVVPLIEGLCAQICSLRFEIIGGLRSHLLLFFFGRKSMLKEKAITPRSRSAS